jgi:hypothetical protein
MAKRTSRKSPTQSVASRGIKLARRPEGVTQSALKRLPAQIGSWFLYLQRGIETNEKVLGEELDNGDWRFRIVARNATTAKAKKPAVKRAEKIADVA